MITREALAARHIPFSSLRYTTEAFIDYCIPGCNPKYNYALIGSGVAQNPNQPVNLRDKHGFQVGAVSMPHGKTNPPHMHFTCEVFICMRGDWRIDWGFNPDPSSAPIGTGDLVSVPTWIYRSFTNTGVDDGFMFTALGGDSTGGILWGPDTLAAAAENGVYLTEDYRMIDVRRDGPLPPDVRLLEPMTPDEIAALRRWSPQQMSGRIVRFDDLAWSRHGFLDSALPGGGAQLASAIGLGVSGDRDAQAPIANAHGLSIEWLRIPQGGAVSRHLLAEKQVLVSRSGSLTLEIEAADGKVDYRLDGSAHAWDSFAIPGDCWRRMVNTGDGDAVAVLMTAGDHRKRIRWDDSVVAAAAAAGLAIDADGFVAPKRFVDRAQR
ncbi:MAG: hypothetical protein JNM79_00595 [Burkholderiales bacterium]|nr:hypothetical protein [Burkholderiales bacterium]